MPRSSAAGSGATTAWTLDTSGTLDNPSSTTVSFPALTPTGSSELYFGYAVPWPTPPRREPRPGFTYALTAYGDVAAFDPDVSGAGVTHRTAVPGDTSSSIGVLLSASDGAPPPAPSRHGVSPSTGPTARGNFRHHHRNQPHRGHHRQVRHGLDHLLPRVRNPDRRHLAAGVCRSGGHHGHHGGRHLGNQRAHGPVHLLLYATAAPHRHRGLNPSSGPTQGGTTVTITGTNLAGATAVTFGTMAAAAFIVNTNSQITAATPGGDGHRRRHRHHREGTSPVNRPADQFTFTCFPTAVLPTVSAEPLFRRRSRWDLGHDHRHQLHRSHRRRLRHHGGHQLHRQLGHLAHRHGPGRLAGHRRRHRHHPGWHERHRYRRQVHLPGARATGWSGNDGGIFSFGGAPFEGSLPGLGVHVNNIVGVVPTSDGKGYWMVGSDGGVFAFGDAGFVGSLPGLGVHVSNIVGVVPTSDGKGYWMIGSDGGVFAFGDAGFVGSLPGLDVHVSNIVAVVPTSTGKGYWMIGSDGGVFAFGDAGFVGSLPGLGVHVSNVVGVVPTSAGKGYWMVGSDGGVFAFGDAGFVGSLPGLGVHVTQHRGRGRHATTARATGWWAPTAGCSPSVTPASWDRSRASASTSTTSWPSPASRPSGLARRTPSGDPAPHPKIDDSWWVCSGGITESVGDTSVRANLRDREETVVW